MDCPDDFVIRRSILTSGMAKKRISKEGIEVISKIFYSGLLLTHLVANAFT